MSAHTPGPWRAVRDEVWVGKSRRVCPRVTAGDSLPLGEDFERAKANARLMAAAPELLEALEKFIAWSKAESDHKGTTFWERLEMLRDLDASAAAAIAKATGSER